MYRIALVATFHPRNPAALELSYARAFWELGHRVECFELTRMPRKSWQGGQRAWLDLAHRACPVLEDAVIESRPTHVVIVKGLGVFARSIERWRAMNIKVVNIFPDAPDDAVSSTRLGEFLPAQFSALTALFVHDRFAAGRLRAAGIPAHFIAFARDPALCDPSFIAERPADHPRIVFVGNADKERARYLRALAGLSLGVWGDGWSGVVGKHDRLRPALRGGTLWKADLVNALAHAEVSINILRQSQKTAHNMRTFDSPACRVCTLSERTNGVLELMADGKEVVTFGSPEELRSVVQRLLADPKYRRSVAEAGWERVRQDTYAVRARDILALCDHA